MAEESLQKMYLLAHMLLHPEGEAIRELVVAGVSSQRILALYPHEFTLWVPELTRRFQEKADELVPAGPRGMEMLWRGIPVRNYDLLSRLRGIQEGIKGLGQMPIIFTGDPLAAFLNGPAGTALLRAMGFGEDGGQPLHPVAEMLYHLAYALNLGKLRPLRGEEDKSRVLVQSALCALLPEEFPMERPLIRSDTMMLR